MPTHVIYKGKHYELPVDGLDPQDALLRVRNLLGETGDGTRMQPLQRGATPPEGFEPDAPANQDTAAEAGVYTQPSTPTMLKALALEAAPMAAAAPAVISKVLPMIPRALGGITGAMEGNKRGGPLGAVIGGATGVALPGTTGAGTGALEGYEAGGVPGAIAGAALGSLSGAKGRAAYQGGKRLLGKLGNLALEAPEAGAAAEAMNAAKATQAVKAAETLAPAAETAPAAVAAQGPKRWQDVGLANFYSKTGTPTDAEWARMGGEQAKRAWLESRNLVPGAGRPQDVVTAVSRGAAPNDLEALYGSGQNWASTAPKTAPTSSVPASSAAMAAAPKFEGKIAVMQRLGRVLTGGKPGKVWILLQDGKPVQAVESSQAAQAAIAEASRNGEQLTSTWTRVFAQ